MASHVLPCRLVACDASLATLSLCTLWMSTSTTSLSWRSAAGVSRGKPAKSKLCRFARRASASGMSASCSPCLVLTCACGRGKNNTRRDQLPVKLPRLVFRSQTIACMVNGAARVCRLYASRLRARAAGASAVVGRHVRLEWVTVTIFGLEESAKERKQLDRGKLRAGDELTELGSLTVSSTPFRLAKRSSRRLALPYIQGVCSPR